VENEVNTNNTTKGNGAGRTFQTSRTGQRRWWRIRKETEKFGRGEGGFLMKKEYKKGGVSL